MFMQLWLLLKSEYVVVLDLCIALYRIMRKYFRSAVAETICLGSVLVT